MILCSKCGQPIDPKGNWQIPEDSTARHIVCPSEAERSGVLQGCLPSTNCSAGAGADALSDSLINSVVPREEAVRRDRTIITGDCEVAFDITGNRTKFLLMAINPFSNRVLIKMEETKVTINSKPPTLAAQRERAIPRNAKLRDAGESGVE